jgi:trigger factor
VEFPEATVVEHEKMMTHRYVQLAKIPGFRPGKAPLQMIKERYKNEIHKEVVSHLLEAGLAEAIEKTHLTPVNRPRIELGETVLGAGKPFEFHAEFEVQPEIELRDYKGVPLKNAALEASDEEVQKTLENLRERMAVLEPLEASKPSKGEFGVIQIGYTVEGEPEKKEAARNVSVEIGAGKLLPELDAALEQMSVGEARQIKATFPAEYDEKTLAGKTALFECKLLELKKKVLPELNDAFANQLKDGTTLLALKQEIAENILSSKKEENERTQRQEVMDYLIANNKFDVPGSLIEAQSHSLLEWMEQDLKKKGFSSSQLKEDDLKAVRKRAEHMVRTSLLLKEIAIKEKISLDEAKLQGRIDAISAQLNRSDAETKKILDEKGMLSRLRDEVLTDQVFDFLIKNALFLDSSPRP